MHFINKLDEFHLLKHDFYKAWSAGILTKKDLHEYVCQYYHHVNNFPRYLSAIHTICDDIAVRKVILGNLIDEEHGDEDHPELLLRFAEGIGLERDFVKNAKIAENAIKLNDVFFECAKSSVAEGVGALLAYERQVPEVAKSKLSGLELFYGITDPYYLKFFTIHIHVDEWHSEECVKLLSNMNEADTLKAQSAALKIVYSLWLFLDNMEQMRKSQCYINV